MGAKSGLSDSDYEELLKPMARELSAMARWVSETSQRLVVLFEGRDTAGKGGSIDMIARLLNPRQCRVVALPSPNERSTIFRTTCRRSRSGGSSKSPGPFDPKKMPSAQTAGQC
jgi:polyphosphate kinase 2 (PPK2 family)